METVYKNGFCNITATASETSDGGLFFERSGSYNIAGFSSRQSRGDISLSTRASGREKSKMLRFYHAVGLFKNVCFPNECCISGGRNSVGNVTRSGRARYTPKPYRSLSAKMQGSITSTAEIRRSARSTEVRELANRSGKPWCRLTRPRISQNLPTSFPRCRGLRSTFGRCCRMNMWQATGEEIFLINFCGNAGFRVLSSTSKSPLPSTEHRRGPGHLSTARSKYLIG